MPYKKYQPNERIVDRAIMVWTAMLENPKYDALGPNSPESLGTILSNTMTSMLTAAANKNNTPTVLRRFGIELKKILMHGHKLKYNDKTEYETIPFYLTVDYHPDHHLSAAAERSGLKMEFPWKSSMFLDGDYLAESFGYGAPRNYHYPLSGNRWLVTRLSGEDMPKIIARVEDCTLDLNLNSVMAKGGYNNA